MEKIAVSYHSKTSYSEKNSHHFGLNVCYEHGSIPLRTFAHKGIDSHAIIQRIASDEEIKSEHTPYWRVRFIVYQKFQGLLEDEILLNYRDRLFMRKLFKMRNSHSFLFKDKNFQPSGEQMRECGFFQFKKRYSIKAGELESVELFKKRMKQIESVSQVVIDFH